MSSLYTERFSDTANYAQQASIFLQFVDDVNYALSSIKVSKETIKDAENSLLFFKEKVKTLLLNFADLNNAISDLFDKLIVVGETQIDTFNLLSKLSTLEYNVISAYGGELQPIETASRDELIINVKVFQQVIAGNVMARLLPVSKSIDYQQASLITANIDMLSKQYNFILDNNIFVDGAINVILNRDLSVLSNQFSETIEALKELQFNLPLEQTIDVQRSSLLPLIYRYYGKFDKLDKIVFLNNDQSPFNITGDYRILTDV